MRPREWSPSRIGSLTLLICVGALVSCAASKESARSGEHGPPHDPPPKTASVEVTPLHPGPPRPWDDLSFEERKAYMRDTVVPTMKPIFEAWDEDFFADFGCATCHGADPEGRHFEMPNTDIAAMFPSGSAEQKKIIAEQRDWLVFMFNEVVPNMGDLLGVPRYDKETKTGFTCFYCHPKGTPAPM